MFTNPETFKFVIPFSNSLGTGRQEIANREIVEGVHYHKATAKQIDDWDKEGKTLVIRNEADTMAGKTGSQLNFSAAATGQ